MALPVGAAEDKLHRWGQGQGMHFNLTNRLKSGVLKRFLMWQRGAPTAIFTFCHKSRNTGINSGASFHGRDFKTQIIRIGSFSETATSLTSDDQRDLQL